jgi:hypothetical protein
MWPGSSNPPSFASASFADTTTTEKARFPRFLREPRMALGSPYLSSLAHKSTGLSALQLLEKTFHVQNMLGLSFSKSGKNG